MTDETLDVSAAKPTATRPGSILSEMRLADVATLLNAYMGIIAMLAALAGDIALAWILVFVSIIVDGIDGAIARLGGGGGPLGSILDTLADVVTFLVAPAFIILATYGVDAWSLAAALAIVTAGLLRLARFQTQPGDAPHFWGLSTPGGALLVGSILLIWELSALQAFILTIVAADLMLMRRQMPKLRGRLGVAGVIIILANAAVYFAAPDWLVYSLGAQLAFMAAYVIGGPMYLRKVQA